MVVHAADIAMNRYGRGATKPRLEGDHEILMLKTVKWPGAKIMDGSKARFIFLPGFQAQFPTPMRSGPARRTREILNAGCIWCGGRVPTID